MKFTVRKPVKEDNIAHMKIINRDEVTFDSYSEELVLSIDGSTTNSGIAVIRYADAKLLYSISASREKDKESPVRYKLELKKEITELLIQFPQIRRIYYEEPCIGYAGAVANLFMLRTFIEEMIIENEPRFNYIQHFEIPNMRWKKLFLSPETVPLGTDNQKEAVRKKMVGFIPCMSEVSQDEIDAYSMGFACIKFKETGQDESELESKKSIRGFKYNIEFIGAETDDAMLDDLLYVYAGRKGRQSVLENGIKLVTMGNKDRDFDKFVYRQMGDEDKLLVIKYQPSKHGNLTLKYKIGTLAARYDYLYALVWRVNPKR